MMIQTLRRAALAAALLAATALSAVAQTAGLVLPPTSQTTLPMTAGQIPIGQGVGSNPAAVSLSGDCTLNSAGAITCLKTNGTAFGTAATAATGTSGGTLGLLNASKTDSGTLNQYSGHIASSGSAPTLSSCGTSPAIVGDDKDGQVTMGTGTPTGCVITFNAAYTAAPLCTVAWQATPLASQSYAVTTTAITLTQTATSSNRVNYHCAAQSGG